MKVFAYLGVFVGVGVVILALFIAFDGNGHLHSDNGAQDYSFVIDPQEVVKNPYRLKGQYGMLDPAHIWVDGKDGVWHSVSCLGPCVSFVKMLDEHTALYSVGYDNLAVDLDDSNAPETSRPWRVQVEGTQELTNAFGGKMNTASLRFEGYGVMPDAVTRQSIAPPAPESKPVPEVQEDLPDNAPATQPPAPIERQTPQ